MSARYALMARARSRLLQLRASAARLRERIARRLIRLSPPEQNRLFLLTVAIGGACGLAAVLFHLAIRSAEQTFIERAMQAPGRLWIPATILMPTLGGAVVGAALHYVLPAARGSGIPQVKMAFAVKSGRMRLRDALGKFVLSALQIGSGASLG